MGGRLKALLSVMVLVARLIPSGSLITWEEILANYSIFKGRSNVFELSNINFPAMGLDTFSGVSILGI